MSHLKVANMSRLVEKCMLVSLFRQKLYFSDDNMQYVEWFGKNNLKRLNLEGINDIIKSV